MVHIVRLSKSGNSYGINIPAEARDALHLCWGDQLVLSVEKGRLVVVKVEGAKGDDLGAAIRKAHA